MLNKVFRGILIALVISLLFLSKTEADMVKVRGLGEVKGIIEREGYDELVIRIPGAKLFLDNNEVKEIIRASEAENERIEQRLKNQEKENQKLQKYTSKSYKTYLKTLKAMDMLREVSLNIDIIKCNDNVHSYAACLPPDYEKREKCPVLFCFDPGGDGTKAVGKFAFAAEERGWIIVGSLDAKNGPWGPILKAQSAMLEDIKNRYKVDQEKYYAAGLSGGARMAYTIAYKHPFVFRGVIACASGFGRGHTSKNIAVYHCIGDKDYNLREVKRAHTRLIRKNTPSTLDIFLGGHEWPPARVLKNAVNWIAHY